MTRRVSIADPRFEYDPEDADGFHSGMFRLGAMFGARATGMSVYELPPGQSVCPYHYEYGEEEWLLVLIGHPTVRTPSGTARFDPFDVAFFPTGPDGAHEIRNDTDEPVRVVMWSQVVFPTATAYPDSGKVGVYTGDPAEALIVERSSGVDYFKGETR